MPGQGQPYRIAYAFQGGIQFSEHGAPQLHIYHIIKGLQQAGHRATLVALQPGRRVLCTEDIAVVRSNNLQDNHYGELGLSGSSPFKLMESGVRRLHSELRLPYLALFDSRRMYEACCRNLHGHDLIHERHNLLAMGGALASRKLGLPLVLEFNADPIWEGEFQGHPEHGFRKAVAVGTMRFCFKTAARIICVSSQLKENLVDKWGVDAAKIVVVPNAADTQAFGQPHDSESLKRKLGLTTEPTVMFIGGFYAWHDLQLLLESFSKVLQQVPCARLILVGSGRTYQAVEAKVLEYGLRQAVIMTGVIDHEQVPGFLSVADVVVAPCPRTSTRFWGSPLKLFEYMAAGKPVVASQAGQIAEVIQDGVNGLLVEPGDVEGFANAILVILNDPRKREFLGRNARRQAVEQHSWERYVERLEEVYTSIL